jgi:trans-aconitate methyltransferase
VNIPPDRPESLARLRSILAQLPLGGLPPRLVNVGCGMYPSARLVQDALPAWALYGLDLNGDALRRARRDAPSLRLIQADAKDLPGLLRARFGLVLVRHPDVYRRAAWCRIIPRLPALLAPEGFLLITLYAPEEVETMRALDLPPPCPLDESALAPPDLAGRDRYALVFRSR